MKGFFAHSEMLSKAPSYRIPRCGACGLYKQCKSPKMEVSGEGEAGILIVAEAPGKSEDKEGRQLVGVSGRFMEDRLREVGINMRRDCWLTNSLICRPPDNETPTTEQIDWCLPNLRKTIDEKQPSLIIPIGAPAMKAVLRCTNWKKGDFGSISRWVGWHIPCQSPNAWICPTFHPSFVMRSERDDKTGRKKESAARVLMKQHLEAAVKRAGSHPWKMPRDWESEVQVITDVEQAAKQIDEMQRRGGRIAFDYECNCLKPDDKIASIVSCSICWQGKKTIAYPWHGPAIEATARILADNKVEKIAAHLKFEHRWTKAKLGFDIENWIWDTMVNAHVMDCRAEITSLKFQAFVLLGAEAYDEHISPFLKGKTKRDLNRIGDINLRQLLLYNGLDSLLEYYVAMKQMRMMK